jgi:hypothetical protein
MRRFVGLIVAYSLALNALPTRAMTMKLGTPLAQTALCKASYTLQRR